MDFSGVWGTKILHISKPTGTPRILDFSSDAFQGHRGPELCTCVRVYCEPGTLGLVQGDTFSVSVVEHRFLAPMSFELFVMELCIGDKVFYTRSIGLRVPTEVMRHMCIPWGNVSAPGARWASFVTHAPPVAF